MRDSHTKALDLSRELDLVLPLSLAKISYILLILEKCRFRPSAKSFLRVNFSVFSLETWGSCRSDLNAPKSVQAKAEIAVKLCGKKDGVKSSQQSISSHMCEIFWLLWKLKLAAPKAEERLFKAVIVRIDQCFRALFNLEQN